MVEAPLRYAVLLARLEELKLPDIAKALSAFRKVPIQDAARNARNCWGLPAENLEKDEAQELSARLKENGVESLSLPQSLIEESPAPLPTTSLEFRPDAILVNLKSSQSELLAKENIRLIAAVGLKQTITTTMKVKEGPSPTQKALSMGLLLAGLPIRIGGASREVEKKKETTELFFILDLCLRKPVRRFRIDALDFNFSCLKARMGYTAPQNFRTLIQEMSRLCPQAIKNRGTQILLDGAPVASMGYDAITDLDRESRWLLTLDSLKDP